MTAKEYLDEMIAVLNTAYLHKHVKFHIETTGPTSCNEQGTYYQFATRLIVKIHKYPSLVVYLITQIVAKDDLKNNEDNIRNEMYDKALLDIAANGLILTAKSQESTMKVVYERSGVDYSEYFKRL